jgi:two-component system NarL family response regulator
LLLVDDHEIVTEGLKFTLEMESDLRVIGQAQTGEEAIRMAQILKPDVILLDLKLKGETGVDVCRQLLGVQAEARVIILTTFMEEQSLFDCILAGARGYVLKDVELAELKGIIRKVARGESVLDSQMTSRVMHRLRENEVERLDPARLTARQIEVLTLLADGLTNKDIGRRLYLSESTVKYHVRHAMELFGVERRAELVREVMRRGIVS